MANKFKPGDRVVLKNSTTLMTIKGHPSTHTANGNVIIQDRYECLWHDGRKTQQAVFAEDALKLISAD